MTAMRIIRTTLFLALFFIFNYVVQAQSSLVFIENKGQFPSTVDFVTHVPGGNIYFEKTRLRYSFYDTRQFDGHHKSNTITNESGNTAEALNRHAVFVEFIGSDENQICIEGERGISTKYNFYLGGKENWASNITAYESLKYASIYPGIDLKFYTNSNLKYDFIVSPGANPENIKMSYKGLNDMYIEEGSLYLQTSINQITELRPFAYQIVNNKRTPILCEYYLKNNMVNFTFPNGYDPCYDLIIDPELIFSTYSGSSADNWGNSATPGSDGSLISGGITNHYDGGGFPSTPGAYQTEWAGIWDIAILKYDSTGSNLEYATYLGGSGSEVPVSMITNEQGELIIYGLTNSEDYPTTASAYQDTFGGGDAIYTILAVSFYNGSDGFISKLSPDGSQLLASTYFGAEGNDCLMDSNNGLVRNYGDEQRGEVYLDDEENILIIGTTSSDSLFKDEGIPSFERNYQGGETDAVFAGFNPDLSQMLFGGYIGGSNTDAGFAVKVDGHGNYLLAGGTASNSFKRLGIGADSTHNGDVDGWIMKINKDSLKISSSTFVGTNSYDQIYFLDTDVDNNVYVYGQTAGDFLVKGDVYSSGGGQFLQKYKPDLSGVLWSTNFGDSNPTPDISPTAFLVSECDNIYLSGWGGTINNSYIGGNTYGLAVTGDAYQTETNGSDFYLMTLSTDAKELLYATFLGGEQSNTHVDGGTSRFDKSGIVYHAVCASCGGYSNDFPATAGAWSTTNNSSNCNNAAFKFDLASLRAVIETNTVTFDQPGVRSICYPDSIVFQNFSIGGEYYEWDLGDGTQIVRTDTAYLVHQYQNPGSYTVTMRAVDENTCTGEDLASLVVQIYDPWQKADDDKTICEGEGIKLGATGGSQFEWYDEDGLVFARQQSPTVKPDSSTTYTVQITDNNGCSTTDTQKIEVIPATDFEWSVGKEYNCFGRQTLKLTYEATGKEYIWDFGDGNTASTITDTHFYEKDGVYNIQIIDKQENGCVFNDEQTININTIKIPNVFTPSDGEPNATFEIISENQVSLSIYNRWGKLIYENENYDSGWTGNEIPGGVYYYEAIIKDETTCKGWVHLLK